MALMGSSRGSFSPLRGIMKGVGEPELNIRAKSGKSLNDYRAKRRIRKKAARAARRINRIKNG